MRNATPTPESRIDLHQRAILFAASVSATDPAAVAKMLNSEARRGAAPNRGSLLYVPWSRQRIT